MSVPNNEGDLIYNRDDVCLYRFVEDKTYRFIEMLHDAGKNAFANSTGNLINVVINHSNVAGVPAGNPFDHFAGQISPSLGSRQMVLFTPVEKP